MCKGYGYCECKKEVNILVLDLTSLNTLILQRTMSV